MAEVIHRYQGRAQSAAEKQGKTRKQKLDAELVQERAGAVRANRMRAEMLLAKSRNELVEKELVLKQAAYLLVALRQRILAVPSAHARELAAIADVHRMSQRLRAIMLNLLSELQHLPERVTDPHWLESLEKDVVSFE